MAERTPATRNRWVDFLRAASILAVVFGHWLMAAPYLDDGSPQIAHLLDVLPWSQWLTWIFQVMPVFFFVGGFSNGVTWSAALRDGRPYGTWLAARVQRLLGPVVPLVVVWFVLAVVARASGVHPEMIRVGSQIALVPTWFLAVYVLVVLLVPWTHAAWRRFGMASVVVPVVGAGLVDAAFFAGLRGLGFANYLFVWLSVHQLGYAWGEGRVRGLHRGVALAVVGLGALAAMTELGPYPRSLVGVPTDEISNSLPPKLPLLALGAFQVGVLLILERPARRLLERPFPWTLTVLVNGMIMTIFLWHSTVMMLLFGAGFWAGGVGLEPAPGSGAWWAWRVAWIAAFVVVGLPVVGAFARFERSPPSGRPPSTPRLVAGGAMACAGMAQLALRGVVVTEPWITQLAIVSLVLLGCALARALPRVFAGSGGMPARP